MKKKRTRKRRETVANRLLTKQGHFTGSIVNEEGSFNADCNTKHFSDLLRVRNFILSYLHTETEISLERNVYAERGIYRLIHIIGLHILDIRLF